MRSVSISRSMFTNMKGEWINRDSCSAFLGLFIAIAIGWLSGLGVSPFIFPVVLVSLLGALYIAMRPTWLLWCAIAGGLLISGTTMLYFPQIQKIRWALAPISIVLVMYAILARETKGSTDTSYRIPGVVVAAIAFIGICIVTTIINDIDIKRLVIAAKGYFQVWGLLFALTYFPWSEKTVDRIPKILIVIGIIQFPLVLHQLLFLVPKRVGMGNGIVPIDIVAGTFGANIEGGGANAILNAYQVVVFSGMLAAHHLGLLSLSRLIMLSSPLLFPLVVNEAKVSVIYLFSAFLVIYAKDLVRRPLRFVIAFSMAIVLCLLLLVALAVNAPEKARIDNLHDLILFTYEYNISEEEVHGKLSRWGALEFWANKHSHDVAFDKILFGHGLGFTRVSGLDAMSVSGETGEILVKNIPEKIDLEMNIGNTAVAALLWETGIAGLFCVFGLLFVMYRSAARLEQIYSSFPVRVASFQAIRVGAVIVFITLWHKHVFVFDPVYQTFLMILLGYVGYWDRKSYRCDH